MGQSAIEERQRFSDARLNELRSTIAGEVPSLEGCPNLCVYATGSYARRDAGRFSDLDIFFVNVDEASCSRIQQMLVNADLIRLCQKLDLPEFSGDGQYLTIHSLASLVGELGSQMEDYANLFTARLLLLLESTPLHNETVYDAVVAECVRAYYRDFHDHMDDFLPLFLANDICRFWKTLCLNYEHKRNRPAEPEKAKRKSHLKNFKLKFSRLLTCFSMVACLCDRREADHPDKAIVLVKKSPLERLKFIAEKHEQGELLGEMLDLYDWFLESTDRSPDEAEEWIAAREVRREVFPKAERFGDLMYDMLGKVAQESGSSLRYLVV